MSRPTEIHLPPEQLQQYTRYQQENARLAENLSKVTAQLEIELTVRRSKWVTRKEISNLGADVPVYKIVGKAFLLDDVPSTVASLRAELGKSDQRILQLKKTGIYIVGQQDEVGVQIRELVKPFLPK
jgi:chaperonin cofactor prefoldin